MVYCNNKHFRYIRFFSFAKCKFLEIWNLQALCSCYFVILVKDESFYYVNLASFLLLSFASNTAKEYFSIFIRNQTILNCF